MSGMKSSVRGVLLSLIALLGIPENSPAFAVETENKGRVKDGRGYQGGSGDPRDWAIFNPWKFRPENLLIPAPHIVPRKTLFYTNEVAFPHDPTRTNVIYGRGSKSLPTVLYARAFDVLQLSGKFFQAPPAGESKTFTVDGKTITIYGTTWYTPLANYSFVGNPVQISPFDPARVYYRDKDLWPAIIYGVPGQTVTIANQQFTFPAAGKSEVLIAAADGRIRYSNQDKSIKPEVALAAKNAADNKTGSTSQQAANQSASTSSTGGNGSAAPGKDSGSTASSSASTGSVSSNSSGTGSALASGTTTSSASKNLLAVPSSASTNNVNQSTSTTSSTTSRNTLAPTASSSGTGSDVTNVPTAASSSTSTASPAPAPATASTQMPTADSAPQQLLPQLRVCK